MSNSYDFKDLQKVWYQKLKESGFKDVEDEEELTFYSRGFFQKRVKSSILLFESSAEYYAKGFQVLELYQFKNDTHRKIWKLHCEGLSIRKIALAVPTYKKSMIHYLIKRVRTYFLPPRKNMQVIIRSYEPTNDDAYIYSTWIKYLWYSPKEPIKFRKNHFFKLKSKEIKEILSLGTVKIACLKTSPSVIIGYIIVQNHCMKWRCIKKDYHHQGIEELLLKSVKSEMNEPDSNTTATESDTTL